MWVVAVKATESESLYLSEGRQRKFASWGGVFLATAASLAAALVAVQPGTAQPAPTGGYLKLYIEDAGLSPAAPTAEADKTKSVLTSFSSPGLSNFVDLGSWKVTHDLTFTTDGVATLWLSAEEAAVITSFDVQIRKGSNEVWRSGTGTNGEGTFTDLGPEPTKYELGVGLLGTEWKAGDVFNVRVILFGVAEPGTPTDVFLHYGSLQHPSGVAGSVDAVGALTPAGSPLGVFLAANNALSLDAPTAEQDLARESGNAGPGALASASAWSWGKTTLPEDTLLVEDSVFMCWTTLQGTAAAVRGFRVTVDFKTPGGTETVTKSAGLRTTSYQSATGAPSVTHWALGLPTAGLELPAGTEIDVKFQIWSSHADPPGKVVILYGSATHPSGLVLGAEGGSLANETTNAATNTTVSLTGSPKTVSASRASTTGASAQTTASGAQGDADGENGTSGGDGTPTEDDGRAKDITTPEAILPTTAAWLVLAVICGAVVLIRRG